MYSDGNFTSTTTVTDVANYLAAALGRLLPTYHSGCDTANVPLWKGKLLDHGAGNEVFFVAHFTTMGQIAQILPEVADVSRYVHSSWYPGTSEHDILQQYRSHRAAVSLNCSYTMYRKLFTDTEGRTIETRLPGFGKNKFSGRHKELHPEAYKKKKGASNQASNQA